LFKRKVKRVVELNSVTYDARNIDAPKIWDLYYPICIASGSFPKKIYTEAYYGSKWYINLNSQEKEQKPFKVTILNDPNNPVRVKFRSLLWAEHISFKK